MTLVMFTSCTSPSPESPSSPPQIVFAETTHAFAPVERGTPITHEFAFENRGGADLTIDKIRSGCACEAELLSERFVEPGAGGRVRVRCPTDTLGGACRRTVSVYSNDPQRPVTVLALRGTVHAQVTVRPPVLYVGNIHRGARVRQQAVLTADARVGEIEAVAADGAPFSVEIAAVEGLGARRTLSLAIAPAAPVGAIAHAIRIRHAASKRVLLEVPVIGAIAPDLVVSPAVVLWKVSENTSADGVRHVLLDNGGPQPVHVLAAEWQPPLGRVAVDTLDPGRRYRVRLTLAGPPPAGPFDSVVLLRTDHPDQPVMRVPAARPATGPPPAAAAPTR